MRYMLLIYSKESDWAALSEKERGQMFEEYGAFTEGIRKSGHYEKGDPLEASTTATTVRVQNGKTVTTDGPFAETREQLGGYYVVKAKDLDEATAIAARIPGAKMGSIEVRPIMEMAG
jgi:hypothetical protein